MEPPPIFERYRPELVEEMRAFLSHRPLPLYDMMRYHLGWVDSQGYPQEGEGGKLLRPTLCLLACEALGGDYRAALPAAVALELIHNFSLIHDDIQDASPRRHHRPTVWRIWGEGQAINVGDGMYALAWQALFGLERKGVAGEKVLRAACLLDRASLSLCEGQYLDLKYEESQEIGVETYLKMVEGKTAALMACSTEVGALLGTEDEKAIRSFGDFGRKLGLAYQIRDDLLDLWGGETTGKPLAGDIQKKKKSFPVVYGLERARGDDKKELQGIYRKAELTEEDIARVLRLLERHGAPEAAQGLAEQYCGQALAALKEVNLSPWGREELGRVISFFMGREH